ncbi:hypothetical protein AB2M62_08060 [Sphingomonas sp. MMS12-HWE2-04]|uniref:hypothetical protein n=1 Tax=Sphingomonas sp. MMS12-HWE2-04 TaxID=3234199 RepID=UPI00384BC87D
MFKGLIACALVASAPSIAEAGDRKIAAPLPGARAVPVHNDSVPYGRKAPLVAGGTFTLPLNPKRFDARPVTRLRLHDDSPVVSRFTLTEAPTKPDWHVDTGQTETTATSGGTYAVRETMNDHRKPRFRRSALGTMLVLRIDGEEESPAFSVGGGGVSAALWRAVPR